MLHIKFIRDNQEQVQEAARTKGFDVDISQLLSVDDRRRALVNDISGARAERKQISETVPRLQGDEKMDAINRSKAVGKQIAALEGELAEIQASFDELMLRVPNVPASEVPVGASDEDNEEIECWGSPTVFDFEPKDHMALAESLRLVDFERPRKFAGSRSYALTGDGVLLEQAVLHYALTTVVSRGFTAVSPPVVVRESALTGTGFFPIGKEDTYHLEKDNLYLVGTSEVGLVSMHQNEVLSEDDLPIRYAGISACFRREAGAAGRDTKGLYRVHYFNKVEQVTLCLNDEAVSREEHERLLGNALAILQGLKLPHRVALACTGELGLGQVRKTEVETWMPSRDSYCETHSCSTLHEFQSRRSMIRYKHAGGGKPQFVHTLNNTAIASPRILIAILENNQNADGSVTIPEVLRPYMGGRERLVPGE